MPQPRVNTASIDSEETEKVSDTSEIHVFAPVAGETFIPTGPPTDAIDTGDSSASGSSMLLVVLMMVGLVGAVMAFAPAPGSFRKRKE